MEAVSNSVNGNDKSGGPQGESLVRSAVEPGSEASGVSLKTYLLRLLFL